MTIFVHNVNDLLKLMNVVKISGLWSIFFEERLPSKISPTVPVAQAYVTVVYEWKEQLRHCKCLAL